MSWQRLRAHFRARYRRHVFDAADDGTVLYVPWGSESLTARSAFRVPDPATEERLLTRYIWSRHVVLIAALLLAMGFAAFMLAHRRILDWFPGPASAAFFLLACMLLALVPTYFSGWLPLWTLSPLPRVGRGWHDAVRYRERVHGAPKLVASLVVGLAFLAACVAAAYSMARMGMIGMAFYFLSNVALILPLLVAPPFVFKWRRLKAETQRLETAVRQRTEALRAARAQLQQRVDEQLRQLERLGYLRHFFAAPVAQRILEEGQVDPGRMQRRELSVIFMDLKGFTTFAETAEPEDVIRVLREYHAVLGLVVTEYQATLEHFAGQVAMAFLNDPVPQADHPRRSLEMALALRAAADPLLKKWRADGHELGLGIGIASGFATVGVVGYEGRWQYAAIGSVTNLAARLCASAADGQVLTTHRVLARAGEGAQVKDLGERTLKGFSRPVAAFEVEAIQGR